MVKLITLLTMILFTSTFIFAQKQKSVTVVFGMGVQQQQKFSNTNKVLEYILPSKAFTYAGSVAYTVQLNETYYAFASATIGPVVNAEKINRNKLDSKGVFSSESAGFIDIKVGIKYWLLKNKVNLFTVVALGMRKAIYTNAEASSITRYTSNSNETVVFNERSYKKGSYVSPTDFNPGLIPLADFGLQLNIPLAKKLDAIIAPNFSWAFANSYRSVYQLQVNGVEYVSGEVTNKASSFLVNFGFAYKFK
jgi:hypothetical protein